MRVSALLASQRIPEPLSRAVSVLHVASVGPLSICHPLVPNSGYLIIILSHKSGKDAVVEAAVGDDDAPVGGELPAVGEIEGAAGDVGNGPTRLLDDQYAGGVVPDLLAIVDAGG